MKLNPISTRQPIFESSPYKPWVHPWYEYEHPSLDYSELKRPNPPTPEMVERAQFKDKTYYWNHK